MRGLLLGIDIGTSATKAVLADESGAVVATGSATHPISRPRPGWSEQDPRDWWVSSIAAAREALAAARAPGEAVLSVGLSGQMHGAVFLGAEVLDSGGTRGEALRPAILWNDQRTGEECRAIEDLCGGRAEVVRLVGNAPLTGHTLPKILWVRRHEPGMFARAKKVLLPKDYVRFRMTGLCATDVGDASGMLLVDVDRRRWSERMLALVGLDPSLLPSLHESAGVTGTLSAWGAGELGLRAGTPVVAGSGDSQAGGVGAGIVRPGVGLAALGTSGVIYAHSARPLKDTGGCAPGGIAGCVHTKCSATGTAAAPGEWCITGCTLSAGGSLEWARSVLGPGVEFEDLIREAAGVPRGSAGLVFVPYLTGERCPYPDPEARGAWIGLTTRHTRGHLVRAVMEGVTFAMAQVLGSVRGVGVEITRLRLGGGGARSDLWRRMQADIYGVPVAMTNTEEGPAYGAALIAGVGIGAFASVAAACDGAIRETTVIEPDAGAGNAYRQAAAVYAGMYPLLRETFHALSRAEG
jgi:xylulokinase